MKRTVLIFGLISGLISSAMMFLTLPLLDRGVINFDNGEVLGYTSIFLSFLLVFFGIRSYRENHGGTITFGRAFSVGILIIQNTCLFYVASWEILYYNFLPDFANKCETHAVQKVRAKGGSEAAVAATKKQYEQFKRIWDNPLLNAAVTMIEPFPVGLVMTLVSAGILRRRKARPELAMA